MPDKKRTATGVLGGLAGLVGLSAVAGVLVAATVTPAIAVSGVAASSAISIFDNMPSVLQIEKLMQPTTIVFGDTQTSFYDQNRSPVEFSEVAPVMYDAILSSEDPRYYQHGGVDLIGTTRALLSNAAGGATQGGSSISQQYVKNVLIQQCERDAVATEELTRDEVLQQCWLQATTAEDVEGYERKLQEMRYAIQLEKKYSKNEILLGYLNIANFGGTTYGIDAASKFYFNVPASQISLSQAATLAGIVQNPNTYRIDQPANPSNGAPDGVVDAPQGSLAALDTMLASGKITQEQYTAAADGYTATKGRQLYVLSRLLDDGKITQEQYDAAAIEPISPSITPAASGCASTGGLAYFCAYVVSVIQSDPAFGETPDDRTRALRQDGLTIYTTLDTNVQTAAQSAMGEYAPSSIEGMDFGSTAVSVEAKTGRVLAIAQNTYYAPGATDDPNYSSIVYAGNLQNGGSRGFNAGSTFKLFTLVDWLEQGKSLRESVNGRDRPVPNMTNSCTGNWVNTDRTQIYNFNRQGGYTGTPLQFTAQSLNTGYLGMAAELDLCDIANVATKMGVTLGDGNPITMQYANSVIGSDAVSPLAMAGAYATVANGGYYCQPKVIDRVSDSDGNDRPDLVPVRSCNQVLTSEVAATAAFALQGVMTSGGTGSQGNPYDGTPLIGKTGTHQEYQSWMIESSTNVATAVWAGNAEGTMDISRNYAYDRRVMDIRYPIARDIQYVADAFYGGDDFPQPDGNLTRQVLRDVPNVVGQTIDQAQATLESAGWSVSVGAPVDSDQPTNIIVAQDPGGRAATGSTITISPSNGQAATVPGVSGGVEQAAQALRAAGFTNVAAGTCTADPSAPNEGRVTGTNPSAGTVTSRSTTVALDFVAKSC